MATVATRALAGNDNYDKIAIKVDAETYKNKWGIIEINIASVALSGAGGTLDIRPSQYSPDSDYIIRDKAAFTSLMTVNTKYYIAVNNGVPGPSAFIQSDETWDLISFIFRGTGTATVTYTITFTEENDDAAANETLVLAVDNLKRRDSGFATVPVADLTGLYGHVKMILKKITSVVIDSPVDVEEPSLVDSVPVFTVANDPELMGYGTGVPLVFHPLSKTSGVKNYIDKLTIYALNNGKIDGNGRNVKATDNFSSLAIFKLDKVAEQPCDDTVTVTIDYNLTVVEAV